MAKFEIEIEDGLIPEGSKLRFGRAREGEQLLCEDGNLVRAVIDFEKLHCIVVEKPKVWREPKLDDLKNGPMGCRFRDAEHESWKDGVVRAIDTGGASFRFYCQRRDGIKDWYVLCQIEVEAE